MTTKTPDLDVGASIVARIVESGGAVRFSELIAPFDGTDDETIASLIYADGRTRLAIGRSTEFSEYQCVLPPGADRSLVLDAAIDVCTQSQLAEGRTLDDAVDALVAQRPDLGESIVRGALLHEIISSSLPTGLATALVDDRELPAPFGPAMPDGRRRYTLLETLGRGSFSVVYLARDEALSDRGKNEALVAIKVLAEQVASGARHRFNREAQLARRVNHENVVRVLDRGEFEDDLFIVYEHIEGETLRGWATSSPEHERIQRKVNVVAQAAAGLGAIHEVGLLHRDVKPGNILVRGDGVVKICDLGLADAPGAEAADAMAGNVVLMAPERLLHGDEESSVRSDVYSLGGVLYWLLTGEYPLGWRKVDIRRAAKEGLAPNSPRSLNASIDRDLEAICAKALSHDPSNRYGAMDTFRADLEAWLDRRPVSARRRSAVSRMRLWTKRQPVAAGLLFLCAASLAGGVGATAYYANLSAKRLARANELDLRIQEASDDLMSLARTMLSQIESGEIDEDTAKRQLAEGIQEHEFIQSESLDETQNPIEAPN